MNRADKYNVLGIEFEVLDQAMEGLAGESNACNRTIFINPDLPDDTKIETFYHELAHMWLSLGGWATLFDEQHEEALAQYLGLCVHLFLRDNPKLPKEGKK